MNTTLIGNIIHSAKPKITDDLPNIFSINELVVRIGIEYTEYDSFLLFKWKRKLKSNYSNEHLN